MHSLEKRFLSIAFVFGLLIIILTPPFQMADEDSHFKKTYLVSNFDLLPKTVDQVKGNYFPPAVLEFENKHRNQIGNTEVKYTFTQLQSLNFPVDMKGEKVFTPYSTATVHPLLYIPQVTMILLVKPIVWLCSPDLINPAFYLYTGRLGNLLFFLACMFYAIKLMPFYKHVMFMLGMMPMTLSLASSLNYDSMVIGVSLLVVSYILRLSYDSSQTQITRKSIIFLCIAAVLLIELKLIYYPLLLLVLLIPVSKFRNTKERWKSIGIIWGTGAVTHLAWMLLTQIALASPGGTSNGTEQVKFILYHPVEYIKVLARTFMELRFYYINSFVGNLGWLDTNLPMLFIIAYLIGLLVLAIFDTNKGIQLQWKDKIITVGIFLFILLLVETSLYIIWTSIPEIGGVGYRIVSGVQGRYFIPCVILGLTLLYPTTGLFRQWREKAMGLISGSIPTLGICSGLVTIAMLLLRYWI
ncbi:DUF2142 domain-containing protein [Paenibacillus sp. MMS18-CY102]|uniref:DUF2142 domain-containing protein n=1 Tax=Paenibacillus sp. MMS18-CY102 TaxID=2682849 RepID=UPI001F4217E8|nr:DUF2142 domain-containing protein [Paenibacillus sp. MMS18-CY102]